MSDRFVVRWPHEGAAPSPIGDDGAWLEDTANGECIFSGDMEPEDACLGRDLDVFVDSLNGVENERRRAATAHRAAMVRVVLSQQWSTAIALFDGGDDISTPFHFFEDGEPWLIEAVAALPGACDVVDDLFGKVNP